MVSDHPKQWDQALAQAEFAYNDSPNKSIGLIQFHIMYGMDPRAIYELIDLGKEEMRITDANDFSIATQSLHEQVKQQLQGNISRYKKSTNLKSKEVLFKVGYLVLVHLRKERFPRK